MFFFVQSLSEFTTFFFYVRYRTGPVGDGSWYIVPAQGSALVRALLKLAVSIYLFLGAPRFREYLLGRIRPKPGGNDLPPTQQANPAIREK